MPKGSEGHSEVWLDKAGLWRSPDGRWWWDGASWQRKPAEISWWTLGCVAAVVLAIVVVGVFVQVPF